MLGIFKKISQKLEPLTQMEQDMAKLDKPAHKERHFHNGGKGTHPTRRNQHRVKKTDYNREGKDLGSLVREEANRQEQLKDSLGLYLSSLQPTPSGEELYVLRYSDNTILQSDGRPVGFPNKNTAKAVRNHLKHNFQIESFVSSWFDHPCRKGGV